MNTIERKINEKLLEYPKNNWQKRIGGFSLNHKELGEIELVMDKSNGRHYLYIKENAIKASEELINHVDEQMDLETILDKL